MGPRFCSEEEWKLSEVDTGMVEYMGGLWQIGGLRKEINGLKKVPVGSLDAMVGMVGTIVKGKGKGSGGIVKNIVKGKRWFIVFFGFITFFCWFILFIF